MTPASITRFSQAMLASIGLAIVQQLLNFDDQREVLARNPQTAGLGDGFLGVTLAFGFAVSLLLWFMIARRASNIAKWILIALTALGLLWLPGTVASAKAMGPLTLGLVIASTVLQIVAIWYLFQPDARDWLEGKRSGDANGAGLPVAATKVAEDPASLD